MGRIFVANWTAASMLVCVVFSAHAQHASAEGKAALPSDPIVGIVNAFKKHPIVALGEGNHGNEQGYEFRLALLRDPRFQKVVNDIVVETGNAKYQDMMDRFVGGEDVDERELRKAWLNTTQPHTVADRPIYENFFRAVREVNKSLPRKRQLRVLLGDPPIDWDAVKSADDYSKELGEPGGPRGRDRHAASVIEREVLAKKRRALIVYGDMHYLRKGLYFTSSDKVPTEKKFPPEDSIVSILERDGKTKVFSIWTHSLASSDLTTIQPDIDGWPIPSLVLIRDTKWGNAPFFFYYPANGMRLMVPTPDGKGEELRLDPSRSHAMQDEFDAVLYLGSPKKFTFSKLTPSLCADPEYIAMRSGRMALAMPPPPGMPSNRPPPDTVAMLRRECEWAGVK